MKISLFLVVFAFILITSATAAPNNEYTFKLVERYRLESEDIAWQKVEYSPEGNYLAGLNFPYLYVWDTSTYSLTNLVEVWSTYDITWTPNGDFVAGVVNHGLPPNLPEGHVYLWPPEPDHLHDPLTPFIPGYTGEIAWSPNNDYVALDIDSGHSVLELSSGIIRNLITYQEGGSEIAWSPDGLLLAMLGINNWEDESMSTYPLSIWKVDRAELVQIGSGTRAVDWSPDGQFLATISGNEIVVLETRDWTPTAEFSLQEDLIGVLDLDWHRDSAILSASTTDGQVVSWDVTTQQEVNRTHVSDDMLSSISWSPVKDELAVATSGRLSGKLVHIFEKLDE
jgi:WD40 repeat protein